MSLLSIFPAVIRALLPATIQPIRLNARSQFASWSTIIYTVRLPKRVRLQKKGAVTKKKGAVTKKKRCGFDVRCGYRIGAAMVRFAGVGAVGVRLRI